MPLADSADSEGSRLDILHTYTLSSQVLILKGVQAIVHKLGDN